MTSLPIGEEARAGYVGNASRNRPREHGSGIKSRRQVDPRVETAGGDGPLSTRGHIFGKGIKECIAPLAVQLSEHLHLI